MQTRRSFIASITAALAALVTPFKAKAVPIVRIDNSSQPDAIFSGEPLRAPNEVAMLEIVRDYRPDIFKPRVMTPEEQYAMGGAVIATYPDPPSWFKRSTEFRKYICRRVRLNPSPGEIETYYIAYDFSQTALRDIGSIVMGVKFTNGQSERWCL